MISFAKLFFCALLIYFNTKNLNANNIWIIDKELSEINFELSVLLAKNVKGKFEKFDGSVVIDLNNKENNRAFFSVEINSMQLNYQKYKELLFSNIFFDESRFPLAIIDSKKFTSPKKSNTLEINAELQIKNIIQTIPIAVVIDYLANDLIQVKVNIEFSRNSYELGKEEWSSTLVLRDKIHVKANLFLIRE